MQDKLNITKIQKLFVALVLACTMLPCTAYAETVSSEVESRAVSEPVDVISITVSLSVVFGGAAGYDIANPQPYIEAPVSFRNAGSSAVEITKIQTFRERALVDVIDEAGAALSGNDTALENQTLYSLYPAGQPEKALDMAIEGEYFGGALNVNANPTNNVFGDTFVIGADSTLDCTFRLNLTNSYEAPNANAKVKSEAADDAQTAYPLSSVIYTISPYIPMGDGSSIPGNMSDAEGYGFYLTDSITRQTYTARQVKGHAQDISENGKNSLFYGMYSGYVYRYRLYECKALFEGNVTPIKVIGILHDSLADGSGKAGLTFQVGSPDPATGDQHIAGSGGMNNRDTNSGGWGQSALRASMNEQSGDFYSRNLHGDLKSLAATVNKEYGAVYNSQNPYVDISQDQFFIPSYYELFGAVYDAYSDSQWLFKEGYQYEYYSQETLINSPSENDDDVRTNPSLQYLFKICWLRSVNPEDARTFLFLNQNGLINYVLNDPYGEWPLASWDGELIVCFCF
ncbi:DUF6273 domain-containing protein [Adlercreutzia sp. ZJ154]|uniref:DUF6273 domain-containing protein n=1 Tax=Adlercreutzia sp. ZJ154 TaxID=2709790 RepID=UPI0013EB97E4|nr:DUF6273 domain-containing protein [Adlercreutzia sp. ZJ154]